MNTKEKLELYWKAKEAYYNGEEIMSDLEFDTLEKELGLENKTSVGTRHNPSYTIQHPFIMGSLSKVQIHKTNDGDVDWQKHLNEIYKYVSKDNNLIITPKFDGCSFELLVKNKKIECISSRGDGEFGKDLTKHIQNKIPKILLDLIEENTILYRGEILVAKNIFEEKYADSFTNPRSFVSGVLNHDYCNDEDFQSMLNDLSIVIYDYRVIRNNNWTEFDWNVILDIKNEEIKKCGVFPAFYINNFKLNSKDGLIKIYDEFDKYRKECNYALDGIVIKPVYNERINNTSDARPKDCVAVKFIPMLQETEVVDITWNLSKTHELVPIIWVNPVEMDGRMVKKCSGANYGNLISKKVSIGSKIIMSLAGDIIPFLYKVTNTDKFDENKLNLPEDTYIVDNIHLMKVLSKIEKSKIAFVNSAKSLNIPTIGTEIASRIFDYITEEDDVTLQFFGDTPKKIPNNILELTPEDIYYGAGGGKIGNNAKKAFKELLKSITLKDIISSCSFRFCGPKVSEQCAIYIVNGNADFEHLAKEGYEWVLNKNSNNRKYLDLILEKIGMDIDTFKTQYKNTEESNLNRIPIIMTGEPTTCSTKAEFLRLHPEYINTGSWKEVKIVFTNSLDSNTGKMKKAREKGIEIRIY